MKVVSDCSKQNKVCWLSKLIFLNEQRTVFDIGLGFLCVMFITIAKPFDLIFQNFLLATHDFPMIQIALNLPFRIVSNDLRQWWGRHSAISVVWLKQGHMGHVMDLTHGVRQLQLICKGARLLMTASGPTKHGISLQVPVGFRCKCAMDNNTSVPNTKVVRTCLLSKYFFCC